MIALYFTDELTSFEARRGFADGVARRLWNTSIVRDSNGRPDLENGACEISISHTEGLWVVMSSKVRCGVDCEKRSRRVEHLQKKFLSESERVVCEEQWAENSVLLGWCVKEAVYKLMSRQGVDFRRDMVIVSGGQRALEVMVECGRVVSLEWRLCGQYLIVYTRGSSRK